MSIHHGCQYYRNQLSYVRVLREIIQLKYNTTPIVISRGDWLPLTRIGTFQLNMTNMDFGLPTSIGGNMQVGAICFPNPCKVGIFCR